MSIDTTTSTVFLLLPFFFLPPEENLSSAIRKGLGWKMSIDAIITNCIYVRHSQKQRKRSLLSDFITHEIATERERQTDRQTEKGRLNLDSVSYLLKLYATRGNKKYLFIFHWRCLEIYLILKPMNSCFYGKFILQDTLNLMLKGGICINSSYHSFSHTGSSLCVKNHIQFINVFLYVSIKMYCG